MGSMMVVPIMGFLPSGVMDLEAISPEAILCNFDIPQMEISGLEWEPLLQHGEIGQNY